MVRKIREYLLCTWGTAALEGVIVLPVAITLMVGGVEFGRALSSYLTADKSIRSATRYLARVPRAYICPGGWGLTKAQNLAVYGSLAGGTSPLVPGWRTSDVTLVQPASCPPAGTSVVVRLRAAVPYTGAMLSAIPGLSNQLTFTVQHEERLIEE